MSTPIMITLAQIKAKNPCSEGWEEVKAANTDAPFPVSSILESNDLDDTLWTLRCLPEYDNLWRKFAWWCARQVSHLSDDPRVEECLAVVWRHSEGKATDAELEAARLAARSAEAAVAWLAARSAAAAARPAAPSAAAAAWSASAWSAEAAQQAKLKQILDAGEWV